MLRRLYDWTISFAHGPRAAWALFLVAFAESSFFPIPPDILLVPMVIAAPERAWRYAGIALLGSVTGGLAGYAIGAFFYDTLGSRILEFYGMTDKFAVFRETYNDWGAWAVLIAGLTPFPYKVITILSGTTGLSLPVFMAASLVARGLRFFVLAGLLRYFGPPIRGFIEKHLTLVFTLFVVLLVGGFALIRYL